MESLAISLSPGVLTADPQPQARKKCMWLLRRALEANCTGQGENVHQSDCRTTVGGNRKCHRDCRSNGAVVLIRQGERFATLPPQYVSGSLVPQCHQFPSVYL